MMNPMYFERATKVLEPPEGMTNKECGILPVFTDGEQCVSLWSMSLRERLSALFFGRVWVMVLSGTTQPPIAISAERSIFEEGDD
jgi:hypothetical protein